MRNAKGVSLVEMLATLAIVCIVAGLGLPAFRSTLERQRCHAAVNLLAATLAHARNTAPPFQFPACLPGARPRAPFLAHAPAGSLVGPPKTRTQATPGRPARAACKWRVTP